MAAWPKISAKRPKRLPLLGKVPQGFKPLQCSADNGGHHCKFHD